MFKKQTVYVFVLITLLLMMGCTAEPIEVTVEVEKEITVEVEVEKEVTVEIEKEITVEVDKEVTVEVTVEVEKEITVEVEVTAEPPDPIEPVIESDAGEEVEPQSELAAGIDEMLTLQVDLKDLGGVVIVKEGDEVTLRKGYGLANIEDDVPFTPDTPFPVGISSSFFVALRMMMLTEDGKIDLQDSICDYLDDCPSAWQPITIHHLLSLQSGLPDYFDAGKFTRSVDEPRTKTDLLDAIRDLPLNFVPGETWSIFNSDSNHLVAGLIIEQITGNSLADEIEQAIFNPLGMEDSGVLDGQYPADFPRLYHFKKEQTIDFSNFYAVGDIYSTVDDMMLVQDAMESEQLLSQAGLDEMFTLHNDVADIAPTFIGGFGYGHLWTDVMEDGQTQTGVRRTTDATHYVAWTHQSSFEPTDVDVMLFINQQNVNMNFVGGIFNDLVFEQGSQ